DHTGHSDTISHVGGKLAGRVHAASRSACAAYHRLGFGGLLPSAAVRQGWDLALPQMMLWTAPPPARRCHGRRGRPDSEDWTMQAVTTIGLDIAKSIFQVHAVDAEGNVAVRRRLKRRYVVAFFQKLPRCLVGIEACASSHHWARELQALGHTVRLMPPAYVRP